jgi:hypothetical protein
MWTGFDDGSIRIYDQVVYILAFEASRHTQTVTAFAETFDGRMFSASLDGSVVKWDSEVREFALIGELRDTSHARHLRATACNLFVGFDSNAGLSGVLTLKPSPSATSRPTRRQSRPLAVLECIVFRERRPNCPSVVYPCGGAARTDSNT